MARCAAWQRPAVMRCSGLALAAALWAAAVAPAAAVAAAAPVARAAEAAGDVQLAVKVADLELQVAQRRRELETVRFDVKMRVAGLKAERERESVLKRMVALDAENGNVLGAQVLDERWRKEQISKKVKESGVAAAGVEKEIARLKEEAEDPRLGLWVQRGVERVGGMIVGDEEEGGGGDGNGAAAREEEYGGRGFAQVGEAAGAFVDTFADTAVNLESAVEKRGLPPVVAFWICFVCLAVPLVVLRLVVKGISGVLHFRQVLLLGYLFSAGLFGLAFISLVLSGVDPVAGLGQYCRSRKLAAVVVSGSMALGSLAMVRSFMESMFAFKTGGRNVYAAQAAVYWIMVIHFFRVSVPVIRRQGASSVDFLEGNAMHYFLYVVGSVGLAATLATAEGGTKGLMADILTLLRRTPAGKDVEMGPKSGMRSSTSALSLGGSSVDDDKMA